VAPAVVSKKVRLKLKTEAFPPLRVLSTSSLSRSRSDVRFSAKCSRWYS